VIEQAPGVAQRAGKPLFGINIISGHVMPRDAG
jgi:hypothetical protein